MEDDGKFYRMLQIVGRKFWKQIKIYRATTEVNTMQRIKKKQQDSVTLVNNLNITIKLKLL